jgi:hypothetical protein
MRTKKDKAGYEASTVSALDGLAPLRPWRLLLMGDGLVDLDAKTLAGLVRILDLFPAVPHLVLETTAGRLMWHGISRADTPKRLTRSSPAPSRAMRPQLTNGPFL